MIGGYVKDNLTDSFKTWLIIIGGAVGLISGGYSLFAKPIQDENRIQNLENKMSYIEPQTRTHQTSIAVLESRLTGIEQGQNEILKAVIDVKKKL